MFDYIPLEDVKVNLKEGKLYFTAVIPPEWVKRIEEAEAKSMSCSIPITIGEVPNSFIKNIKQYPSYEISVIKEEKINEF